MLLFPKILHFFFCTSILSKQTVQSRLGRSTKRYCDCNENNDNDITKIEDNRFLLTV